MNKKAFTLIELLAVIVILAIIALIATPIILGIINSTREEARKRSAEAVSHAVETAYLATAMKAETNGSVSLNNENVIGNTKIENEKSRTTTSITTNDGVVCTLTSDFVLTCTYGSNTEPLITPRNVSNGTEEVAASLICELQSGTSKTTGAEYLCSLDTDRTFYVLGDNADTTKIDLIMDRNYTDATVPVTTAWCTDGGYDNTTCTNINDTSVSHIQNTFNTLGVIVSFPSKDQIEDAYTGSMPTWLYDYTDSTTHSVSDVYGYWTSTPVASDSEDAWGVLYGAVGMSNVYNASDNLGLRPVITISKSSLD